MSFLRIFGSIFPDSLNFAQYATPHHFWSLLEKTQFFLIYTRYFIVLYQFQDGYLAWEHSQASSYNTYIQHNWGDYVSVLLFVMRLIESTWTRSYTSLSSVSVIACNKTESATFPEASAKFRTVSPAYKQNELSITWRTNANGLHSNAMTNGIYTKTEEQCLWRTLIWILMF